MCSIVKQNKDTPIFPPVHKCPLCGKIMEAGELSISWFSGGSFPPVCLECDKKYNPKKEEIKEL